MKTLLLSILLLSVGCVATEKEQERGNEYFFLPFPCDEFPNVAKKSPDPKDWEEDFCGG